MGTFRKMNPRKVIYVSGTRADYGLMRSILEKLNQDKEFDLSICVTGMHLSTLYGYTVQEIIDDQLTICAEIPVAIDSATNISMAQSIGYELIAMAEVFAQEEPDFILLLGDRGEMLAAALAAIHLNIPIVHLHGGERSGTIDEMIRHSISKLSHYHFVATERSKERLIQMGEKSDTVFVIGAPGLDGIHEIPQKNKSEWYNQYHLDRNKKTALMIFHPVVQEYSGIAEQWENLIRAVLNSQLQVLCLEPNSDAGGQLIRHKLSEYYDHPNVHVIKHLERNEFIQCLSHVDLMVGNSSSGIIEAASLNLIAVNVGSRQNLRECGDNIIHVSSSYEDMVQGISEALERPKRDYVNIYGDGTASERALQLLKTIDFNKNILNKSNAY